MNILKMIGAIILSSTQVYTWHKIPRINININKYKIVLIVVINSLLIYFLDNINIYFRPILLLVITTVLCKILTQQSIKKSIVISFVSYFIVLLCDSVFGIIVVCISKNNVTNLLTKYSGGIIPNIIVSLLMIIMVNTKIINKLYNFLLKHTRNLKEYQTLLFLLIIVSCSASTFLLTYYKNSVKLAMIINVIISLVYAIIVFIVIRTKNKYIVINSKYNTSLDNLQAQESIINDYRVMNHENKNNLLTIKGMTNNKKIIGYIESLLNQQNSKNNKILNETLKLPEGGIRGLIYSKMLIMNDNKINCNLHIDKKITVKCLSSIPDSDIVDICQILGVFIDNAIEESIKIDRKEIGINMSTTDDNIYLVITNYCDHTNLTKNNVIKSTKGNGRGYGLQLVKKIISSNPNLTNIREIKKDTFTQKLIINKKNIL